MDHVLSGRGANNSGWGSGQSILEGVLFVCGLQGLVGFGHKIGRKGLPGGRSSLNTGKAVGKKVVTHRDQ